MNSNSLDTRVNSAKNESPFFYSRIPGTRWVGRIISEFTHTEKIIATIFGVLLILSTIGILLKINEKFLIEIPTQGGEITEGVVGIPRFINPVLAFTDADRDLTSLIYSGLMKFNGVSLDLDIAQSYTISSDGRVYSFKLRDDVYFHDGSHLTAEDVEFTLQKIQDSELKSPLRAAWDKVKIERLGEYEIRFTLDRAYEPFLTNTTVGIIPKHIWNNVTADEFTFSNYNIEPIGSGPFKLKKIIRDKGGLPIAYELNSWSQIHGSRPYLDSITLQFYPNEKELIEAYNEGVIDGINSISPKEAQRLSFSSPEISIKQVALPRIFGVFFNQSRNEVLALPEVRKALSMSVNRERIVQEVLAGYGVPIDSPLPHSLIASTTRNEIQPIHTVLSTTTNTLIQDAQDVLKKAGWVLASSSDGEGSIFTKKTKTKTYSLEFELTTSNAPELRRTAELVKEQWEKLGARIDFKIFETGDLNQNVIRPRNYDALLFGEVIGRDLDLFAFWHSSQRNDPGLNIALYTNSKADRLLEEIRIATSETERNRLFKELDPIIKNDYPAVFIFSPDFIYVVPSHLNGINLAHITTSSDRFNGVADWYTETEYIWKFFKAIKQKLYE